MSDREKTAKQCLKDADCEFQKGNYGEAASLYRRATNKDHKCIRGHLGIGRSELQRGLDKVKNEGPGDNIAAKFFEQSKIGYDRAKGLDPNTLEPSLGEIRKLIYQGELVQASAQLEKVKKNLPYGAFWWEVRLRESMGIYSFVKAECLVAQAEREPTKDNADLLLQEAIKNLDCAEVLLARKFDLDSKRRVSYSQFLNPSNNLILTLREQAKQHLDPLEESILPASFLSLNHPMESKPNGFLSQLLDKVSIFSSPKESKSKNLEPESSQSLGETVQTSSQASPTCSIVEVIAETLKMHMHKMNTSRPKKSGREYLKEAIPALVASGELDLDIQANRDALESLIKTNLGKNLAQVTQGTSLNK